MLKNILAIIGSASNNSVNESIIQHLVSKYKEHFDFIIYKDLKTLPHFDPERSISDSPREIVELRQKIEQADGIIICTPEYVFSIPSGLKNLIEWCVSTTVFSEKPCGLITASSSGEKAHEELQLIIKTMMGKFTAETTLLLGGVKSRINRDGIVHDPKTVAQLDHFMKAFGSLVTG